jgi:hypothetical protein
MERQALITTILTVAVAALGVPAISAAEPAERPRLAVRVFDIAGVGSRDLDAALSEAGARLEGSGLSVSWTLCSDPSRAALCDRPLGRDEIIVRLMGSRGADAGIVTLGFAQIDPAKPRSLLATVYWDRVLWVARNAGVNARPLLGRAIAHEIGHLLINTNSHANAGLMRATWSQAELRHNTPADWRFDEGEARQMRASLEALRY